MSDHPESAISFALRRLIDLPGVNTADPRLVEGRPEHLKPASVIKVLSLLYKQGVVSRVPGGKGTFSYTIADLNKLPSNIRGYGCPGAGRGERPGRVQVAHSEIRGKHDGVQQPVNQEEPVQLSDTDPDHAFPVEPPAPRPVAPGIVVVTSTGRAKQLSFADARAIYAQLKEVFG